MSNSEDILNQRKEEAIFYFSQMRKIDEGVTGIERLESQKLLKILKSNYLMMLYNLEEACITSAFDELYEAINSDSIPYTDCIEKIKNKWLLEMGGRYVDKSKTKIVGSLEKLIKTILEAEPLQLNINPVGVGGNIDAKKIQTMCNDHGIYFRTKALKESLLFIKEKRQILAHGQESFSDCARDVTLNDLEMYSSNIIEYVEAVVFAVNKFKKEKRYNITIQQS